VKLLPALAVLALAACAGAPEEEGAERAVARESQTERVECTGRSRIWFREGEPAKVLLCVARREQGLCDRYRVDREGSTYKVTLLARNADCVLPTG
jgi:hypothetical protein